MYWVGNDAHYNFDGQEKVIVCPMPSKGEGHNLWTT